MIPEEKDGKRITVGEVMTRDVVAFTEGDTIGTAVKMLAEKNISGAPVVDGDRRVIGICTEADIIDCLRTRFKEIRMVYPAIPVMGISFEEVPTDKRLRDAMEEINSTPITKIMTRNVASVTPDAHLSDAVHLMNEKEFNRLPVVEDGVLVGIISRGDVIHIVSRLF